MTLKKQTIRENAWYLAVFLFLFLWFAYIKPLTAYDGDDWLYLSYSRVALPLWKNWNPSRVLPEVLMPLCGAAAAFVLTPLTGDYLGSITIVSALVTSGFIAVYVRTFGKLMQRLFSVDTFQEVWLSGLFLLLHFLVFRSQAADNNYLFDCYDLTCIFYYLIPAVLNCTLVMAMMAGGQERFLAEASPAKKSLVLLVFYFAIFSNLPGSVILGIYSGARVLVEGVKLLQKKGSWKGFFKANTVHFWILAAWVVSAVFELCGGRAQDGMGYHLPLLQALKETVYRFLLLLRSTNGLLVLFAAAVLAGAAGIVLLTKKKKAEDWQFLAQEGENLIRGAVMLAAVIILCVKVDITYIVRGEYVFGLYFYGFLALLLALGYLLQKLPRLVLALPLAVCVLASVVNTPGNTFQHTNLQEADADICTAISQELIDEIIAGSRSGQDTLYISAPASGKAYNWPHADFVGDRIATTLYDHGLLDQPVSVILVPDTQMNQKYGLPIPETAEQ